MSNDARVMGTFREMVSALTIATALLLLSSASEDEYCEPPPNAIAKDYGNLQYFVIFLGFPHSGGTIMGAIIDAHPHVILSNEYNVLEELPKFLHAGGRAALFSALVQNSYKQRNGRSHTGYDYTFPQYSGRAANMTVVGDKKCGGTTKALMGTREPLQLLHKLRDLAQLPVKVLVKIRDPLDQIATNRAREKTKGHVGNYTKQCTCVNGSATHRKPAGYLIAELAKKHKFIESLIDTGEMDALVVHHDDLTDNPVAETRRTNEWLSLKNCPAHEALVRGKVHRSARRASVSVEWISQDLASLRALCERVAYLTRYVLRVEYYQHMAAQSGGRYCPCRDD